MIQNLIFGILFLKILFQGYKLFIFDHKFQWTLSAFFNFGFSSRKSQSQQKLAKKTIYFTTQFCSKNLTHLTNLSSFEIENKMLLQHSHKPFSLYKCFTRHISVWFQKKTFALDHFLTPKNFECKCLSIYLYISTRKLFSQRCSKIGTSKVRLWLNF